MYHGNEEGLKEHAYKRSKKKKKCFLFESLHIHKSSIDILLALCDPLQHTQPDWRK